MCPETQFVSMRGRSAAGGRLSLDGRRRSAAGGDRGAESDYLSKTALPLKQLYGCLTLSARTVDGHVSRLCAPPCQLEECVAGPGQM